MPRALKRRELKLCLDVRVQADKLSSFRHLSGTVTVSIKRSKLTFSQLQQEKSNRRPRVRGRHMLSDSRVCLQAQGSSYHVQEVKLKLRGCGSFIQQKAGPTVYSSPGWLGLPSSLSLMKVNNQNPNRLVRWFRSGTCWHRRHVCTKPCVLTTKSTMR